jgi:23S rRNA (pseudouridine1915-N3)-methyltransferase
MHFTIVAVGERMPGWVDEGFTDYARRMPRSLRIELKEVRPESRREGHPVERILNAEADRIDAAIPKGCHRIALDEHGRALTSQELAKEIEGWQLDGRNVAFLIGGPDGLAPRLKAAPATVLRLSNYTLPHGLVRVILAEQLYRAVSILANHPYHRE